MKALAGTVVVAALLASCSRRQLKNGPDGGGVIPFDGGADADPFDSNTDSAPFDGSWTDPPDALPDLGSDRAPVAGQRSFVVTSVLQRDGGFGMSPPSHSFTLVVDGERLTAIAGASSEGTAVALEQTTSGDLKIASPFRFTLTSGCSGSSVTYTELVFAIDGRDTLTGTGRGQVLLVSGDVADTAAATMVLTGVADAQAPTLGLSGGLFTDPFASFAVVASEPLPPQVTGVLRAEDGETIALAAGGMAGSFVTLFRKTQTVLRYATRYRIITDGLTDFAGNPSAGLNDLYFMTRPLPPLAAEDGFESVADATFAGVEVLSGPPAITGTKSLYIPPTTTMPPAQPQLTLRVPVAAGDTVLRFSFRTVRVGSTSLVVGTSWALGSVGGTGVAPALLADSTEPTTTATIGSLAAMLGPVTTASFPLPPDAAGEVILQRTFNNPINCGPSFFGGVAGIIIDDLRVE